ncbi:unnamed protein product [Leptosia nina]|uniref:Sulfotransferase domain-containing protein n=1 Tax=Leptosia nina TaxID=320188 RepID=A0AAV1J7T7_9NEOP
MAADIYNMEIRPSDVFVIGYARSGTTLTQELVWMVANDMDYKTAKSILLMKRYCFLEYSVMINPEMKERFLKEKEGNIEIQNEIKAISSHKINELSVAPSPRFIKTHIPLSLFPRSLLDAKVVYIARDPRDVAVSFFHLNRCMVFKGWTDYWTPYFSHLKEAWEKRHHPNLLFIFYEEYQRDMSAAIKRVAEFFGKTYTDEQVGELGEHLDVKNFKKNPFVNNDRLKDLGIMLPNVSEYIRIGKSGGWRDYFDDEMTVQAEKWIEENLRDTDLRFPTLQ